MPDDNSSEGIEQKPTQQGPPMKAVHSPAPPDQPDAKNTQTITQQSVTTEIHDLEDRIRGAEKWMIGLTGGIVLLTAGIVIVGILQWNAMSGQLGEMKTGGTDTHNLAIAAMSSNRAWIVIRATGFSYTVDKGGTQRAAASVVITNSGPSPAFNVHIWRCAQVRANEPTVDAIPTGLVDCLMDDVGMIGRDIPISMNTTDQTQVVPKNSLPNMHEKGDRFYVWGRMTYDIYPRDKGHFMSFCLTNSGTQLGACRDGNAGD